MRMSCNGCRVLRKGCSENCSIRPCLQWLKSPESQAHATVFLAKFYGRAGLMNLINSGPDHLRPAIFKSLLYEACGRIVNPIYGSVGLLWSGQWQLCQNAVEAVLKGNPITPLAASETAAATSATGYDIRHVTKDDHRSSSSDRVKPIRNRFKRAGKPNHKAAVMMAAVNELTRSSTSHDDSTVSHPDHEVASAVEAAVAAEGDVEERGNDDGEGDGELELELTLGFGL